MCCFCEGFRRLMATWGEQLLIKPSLSQRRPPHHCPLSPEMAKQGNNAAVAKWEILTRMNRKT
jgi:hypothetical protein